MQILNIKKSKAFSLIELSIVILIIGILISGIMKFDTIIGRARLKTAQALTKSSTVTSIEGLSLWLETSLEDSFISSEAVDGAQLSRWNDINPQNTQKYYGVRSPTSYVIYKEKGINYLPSVHFDRRDVISSSGGYFSLSRNISGSNVMNIQTPKNEFTYFLVAKMNSLAQDGVGSPHRVAFFNGTLGMELAASPYSSGWGYMVQNTFDAYGGRTFELSSGGYTAAVAAGKAEIITGVNSGATYSNAYACANGTMVGTGAMYINGSAVSMSSSAFRSCVGLSSTAFTIGGSISDRQYWDGDISELIIFNKALRSEDRKEVEKYLSQKYAIRLSS